MKRKELTQKQEAFCLAYIETGNASAAYREAYPVSRKWKDKSVWEKASVMLSGVKVQSRINDLRAEIAAATVVTEVRVIEEAARIGLFDPGSLFDEDGQMLPIKKMPPGVRAAIASIEIEEIEVGGKAVGRVKKIKLWDKNSAIEKIMRHLGSFWRDNKQKNLFDGVSRETVKGIVERLEAMRGGA